MKTTKTSLAIFLVLTLISSCKKRHTGTEVIAVTIPHAPTIKINQKIEGCEVLNNSNYPYPIDSIKEDSVFIMFRLQNQPVYFPINLVFSISLDNGYLNYVNWKIGEDTSQRVIPDFELTFREPEGEIRVRAIVTWTPMITGVLQTDTVYKVITLTNTANIIGSYKGINTDNPIDTFVINVGEFSDNFDTQNPVKFFGIQNLFKEFPYNLPINVYSKGFGICTAPFPFPDRYRINNKFYSQPYAIALLSKNLDSIVIQYSFVEYIDSISFNGMRTFKRTFSAKKI